MRRYRRQAGFTLIEMLITMAILGVLAAIAIPSFSGYVKKSKTAEAYTFIGEIRQREESYRAEFGQYCGAPADQQSFGAFTPAAAPSSQLQGWPAPAGTWDQLGARPDGPVRFQYAVAAGLPGQNPPATSNLGNQDFWFVVQARGDLDDDGTRVTFEAYSIGTQVWVSEGSGWE